MKNKNVKNGNSEPIMTFDNSEVHRAYAEGMSQLNFAYPNCKIVFFDKVDFIPNKDGKIDTNSPQHRRNSLELTLPTSAILEMAINIIQSFQNNKSGFSDGAKQSTDAFISSMNALNIEIKHPPA